MLWKKILFLHDGSESSLRASEYVAKMFGKTEGVQVTIFGIHEKLPRHELKGESPVVDKLQSKITSMELEIERGQARVAEAKALLARSGVAETAISVRFMERRTSSAAKDVQEEAESGGYGTIVIGRGEGSGLLAGGNIAKEVLSLLKDRAVCLI